MKVLILSDIHGNLCAWNAVMQRITGEEHADACILLGDLVDYGMHSNEVIEGVRKLNIPILCNLRGNHEDAILRDEYARFSSERGRESAKNTRKNLNTASWEYLKTQLCGRGLAEFELDGKKCLAVHGSLADEYWKSIFPDGDLSAYAQYDYVFSGHSHEPHFFERFFPANDPLRRNRKKTVFLNPGSVGQPRNLSPLAQYAVLDTESGEVCMRRTPYSVEEEQAAFDGSVDEFYKNRLKEGV